ncbi:hypothetical protein AB0I28_23230 [Phytomonospora sp. NPDC050363]|uniref:hypothetical protein n=1 Tax=Phytomonospora sp. NPDC050363 TaxID=3155642 RepID=UPI0033FEA0AF
MTVLTPWQPTYVGPDARPEPRKPRPVPRQRVASPVEFHLNLALIKHRRQQSILREHRPTRRRIRIVRFAGFPVPALITRCHCCNAIWPCRELITVLRNKFGWTRRLDHALAALRKGITIEPG